MIYGKGERTRFVKRDGERSVKRKGYLIRVVVCVYESKKGRIFRKRTEQKGWSMTVQKDKRNNL